VVKPLAILEAKRFARHPLFLVGVALLMLSTASELFADPVNVALMGQPIIPAMTLGIFGLIVAARLTQSSQRSLDSLGAHPVPERTRSAALAFACLVPAAVAAVWTVFMLTYFSAIPPAPAT
jgi:dipeptide/tripeptide permease